MLERSPRSGKMDFGGGRSSRVDLGEGVCCVLLWTGTTTGRAVENCEEEEDELTSHGRWES